MASATRPASLLLLVLVPTSLATAQTVQGIGLLPGDIASRAECISADGSTAAGDSTGTVSTAVRFNGTLSAIPQPVSSVAMLTYGLSFDGSAAAGFGVDVNSDQYAWHWASAATCQVLPDLATAIGSIGNDIDHAGTTVVGTADLGSSVLRAVRWLQTGPIFSVQTLAGVPTSCPWSEGIAVSNDGQVVVGTLDPFPVATGVRSFHWTASTTNTLISSFLPGGTFTATFGMSGNGEHVVGWGDTPAGNHAFRWTPDGNLMLDLGVLAGHTSSLAYDACLDGSVVVGFSAPPATQSAAVLWTSALGMVDLNVYLPSIGVNTTDWYLRVCDGISDDGKSLAGTGAYQYAPNQWRTEGWILHVPNAPWTSWPVITFCPSTPNSTGILAELHGSGTTSVAQNDFVLTTGGGVPGQSHVYFYGPEATSVPFGDGTRCVSGAGIGLFRLYPIASYTPGGTAVRHVDLTAPPANGGPGEIEAGSTWYFQDWYRDPFVPGGSGFNLSSGLQVSFVP